MLEQLGPDLWIADGGTVSFFGFDYPTRMAVVRLDDGGLWVWSPITLDGTLEGEVRALGPVRHLVSPNKLHHLFLAAWLAKFPDAKLWGTASTIAKVKALRFTGALIDDAPADWAGQIDQWHFTNSPFLDERRSSTASREPRSSRICRNHSAKRSWSGTGRGGCGGSRGLRG
jgi:hypothetical protein